MTIEILAGPLFTDFSTESNPPAIHSTPFVLLRFLHSTPFVLHTFELPRRGTLRVPSASPLLLPLLPPSASVHKRDTRQRRGWSSGSLRPIPASPRAGSSGRAGRSRTSRTWFARSTTTRRWWRTLHTPPRPPQPPPPPPPPLHPPPPSFPLPVPPPPERTRARANFTIADTRPMIKSAST